MTDTDPIASQQRPATNEDSPILPPPIECTVCGLPFKDSDTYHWTGKGWTHADACPTDPPTDTPPTDKETDNA